MKKFIEAILHMVNSQIETGKTNLLKIEGVESPAVYQAIYKQLSKLYEGCLHAWLSGEKYARFEQIANPKWQQSMHWFMSEGLVLQNDTMTYMRNKAADACPDQTGIFLLLGAEAVQDRGSLKDFGCISTAELTDLLAKDYGNWFAPLFERCGFDSAYLKAIDRIYKALFSSICVDAMRFSDFVDSLDAMAFDAPRDVLETIYCSLDTYWGVPKIKTQLRFDPESKSDIAVLRKAYDFIERKESFLKKTRPQKTSEQFIKYAESCDLDVNMPFPEGAPVFSNYRAFRDGFDRFIAGKQYDELKKQFLEMDFGIIAKILDIKGEAPEKKDGLVTLHGDPMEVYGRLILNTAQRHIKEANDYLEKIAISVVEIRLSQCKNVTDEQDAREEHTISSAYSELVSMLGGMVRFLNATPFNHDDIELEIRYQDDIDPFTMAAFYDQFCHLTKATRNWDDMCHIDFEVIASGEQESKARYRWIFSPKAPWKKSFSLLDAKNDSFEVPSLAVCNKLDSCISCEDDDEFSAQLENCNPSFMNREHSNLISKHFDHDGLSNQFELVCDSFGRWAEALQRVGFFNCLDTLMELVPQYGELIRSATKHFHSMTQDKKNSLYLITDSFTLLNAPDILMSAKIHAAVVPAYHPLTLEKIAAQSNFLRDGIRDMYSCLDKVSPVARQLDELCKIASVSGSLDALLSSSRQYLSCQQTHGYHAVYLPNEPFSARLSADNAIDHIVSSDEEDADAKIPANSEIIFRNVMDYVHTFPACMDGLTLTLINPYDMHHIIAAMQVIDKRLQEEGAEAVINLNIICINAQRNSSGYLKRWLDGFFEEEKRIRVNTYLRYAFADANMQVADLGTMLDGSDICFVYELMKMQAIEFKRMAFAHSGDVDDVQFPMVTMPDVISSTAGLQRSASNSQFQFENSKSFTQLVHVMGNPNDASGTYRTVFALEMPELVKNVLREAHQYSRWTVCIDRAIDRDLITDKEQKIIGFSTGEGDYGDLNVTVSAQISLLDDVQNLLEMKLFERFPSWSKEKRKCAAKFCVNYAHKLDGIRILKALNPNDYNIHSYLAYILTLQCLDVEANESVQRVLVNLDAYVHWFDKSMIGSISESERRPDLLLLEIPMTADVSDANKSLHIRARVIECKMGKESISQLTSAKEQVVHGYEVLKSNWNPDSINILRRHWFNQLYRVLVFSGLNLKDNEDEYGVVEQKLRNILDGKFEIEWECAVYAYWLNLDSAEQKTYISSQDGVDVTMYVAGQQYVQKMLMPEAERAENVQFEVQCAVDEDAEECSDAVEDNLIEEVEPVEYGAIGFAEDQIRVELIGQEAVEVLQSVPLQGNTAPNVIEPVEEIAPAIQAGQRDVSNVRMRLGEDVHAPNTYYWDFGHRELNNRHLLINGNSGCGKTYAIQTLLMELAQQGVSGIIFDYTAGFTTSKLDPAFREAMGDRIKQRVVRAQKIPVNPFEKHDIKIDEDMFFPEDDTDIAAKIANIFKKVYDFGDQQKSSIYSAIMSGLEKYGKMMSFPHMAEELEAQGSSTADRVLSKIKPFIDLNPFTLEESFNWGDIRDSEGVVYIIQLTGYSSDVKLLLTEILLWDIWSFCEKNGDESKPFTVVLDEAQNLDHSAESPSAKILTEGRKFGLSGWYATQFMKPQLSDDEIQRLQQAAQKLYFCPPDEGVMTVAKNIDISSQGAKAWAEKLKKLKKGECVTCGSMVRNGKWTKYEPKIIKITSFQERLK